VSKHHISNAASTKYVQIERVGAQVAFSRFACVFHFCLYTLPKYFLKVLLLS
jgi:hypothetical protein